MDAEQGVVQDRGGNVYGTCLVVCGKERKRGGAGAERERERGRGRCEYCECKKANAAIT